MLTVMAGLGAFAKTRIAWPVSGEHVLALGLLVGAVGLMLAAVFLRQVPPLLLPVSLLVAALAILQLPPETETGWQVVPKVPWSYSGWLPVLLSVAAWFFLLLAILVSGALDAAKVVPMSLLWAIAFALPLSFWGGEKVPAAPSSYQQMAEWKLKEAQGERVLVSLQADKDRLLEHLVRLGVKSSADLSKIPAARPVAKELAEVVQQIEVAHERNERLGSAIGDIESKLRRVVRREIIGEIGMTGEEEKELTRRRLELEEEVGDVSPLAVDALVDELLSR